MEGKTLLFTRILDFSEMAANELLVYYCCIKDVKKIAY